MSEAAVLEKPAVETTETKAAPAVETKGDAPEKGAVTDDDKSVQTAPDAEGTKGEESDEPEDHEAQLERERIEARAEELVAKRLADKEEADRVERETNAETARKARAHEARKTALDTAATLADPKDGRLLAYVNTVTNEYETVPAKSITDVIERLNLDIETASDDVVKERWRNGIERALSNDTARKDFWDWMGTENKPIHEVIGKLAELRAPQTEWAKSLTLETAKSASVTLRKELSDLITAETKTAREKGRTDRGRGAGARERGDGAGGATTYSEYLSLPEKEKAAFNKAHPDEFSAFLGIGKRGN